jgi:hypothetical protein
LAEAVDRQAGFLNARGQPRVIAVGRDDAEAVHVVPMQQVHRVHDEREVGRVLALHVLELLARPYAHLLHHLLPGRELRRHPVAVGAAHGGPTIAAHPLHDLAELCRLRVLGIDQHSQTGPRWDLLLHECFPVAESTTATR